MAADTQRYIEIRGDVAVWRDNLGQHMAPRRV